MTADIKKICNLNVLILRKDRIFFGVLPGSEYDFITTNEEHQLKSVRSTEKIL
jgi:hypothetical protein